MKWGIAFLTWVLTGLYLANACVDYIRLWLSPIPDYPRERVLPHLMTCGRDQGIDYAWVTLGIVAIYYASSRVGTRLRGGNRGRKPDDEDASPDAG